MAETRDTTVQARRVGEAAIIYASDYLNKLSGERIERECKRQLESGFRTLIINFRDTELVNSIGVSILVGVIDAAEQNTAQLIFADVNDHTVKLFEMLGLTRHVQIAKDESEALSWIRPQETSTASRTLTADTRG
ncbi:MAG TPA: STAS domain-containing protein [Pyrinomonadaceae bacterium]|nr:STAS domain-containing protein [Pyrinomonadaceae bacterium]